MTRILLYDVIVGKDPQKAESSLLQLPGLRKYVGRLQSTREREDFRRHMRKYINIWLPDCPFEVSTTNRYTIVTQEAATTARRFIKKGDTVKYLCGNLVAMTKEEEQDLDLTRRDFSIVMSSRKKTPSLFLGPARFANHDCEANAKLVTRGSEGMQVVAVQNIEVGDEITVTYGEDYFGIDNCECLCGSCESKERGGWAKSGFNVVLPKPDTIQPESTVEPTGPYSFRRKRRYNSSSCLTSPSKTPEQEDTPVAKKRKFSRPEIRTNLELPGPSPRLSHSKATKSHTRKSALRFELSTRNLHGPLSDDPLTTDHPGDIELLEQSTKDQTNEASSQTLVSSLEADVLPNLRPATDSLRTQSNHQVDAGRTVFEGLRSTSGYDASRMSSSSSVSDSVFDNDNPRSSSAPTSPSASLDAVHNLKISNSGEHPDSDSELSELSDYASFDDANLTIIHRVERKKKIYVAPQPSNTSTIEEIDIPSTRRPADYIRTPLLLGETYSRWVDCSTCEACWVQPNGYYTRKECPRCERHSKLYGFRWPKTDEASEKGDEEERVLDHRTVHRFLNPEEEARVKKRGRGLVVDLEGGGVRSLKSEHDHEHELCEGGIGSVRKRGRGRSRNS